jgi:hypothetical protein
MESLNPGKIGTRPRCNTSKRGPVRRMFSRENARLAKWDSSMVDGFRGMQINPDGMGRNREGSRGVNMEVKVMNGV